MDVLQNPFDSDCPVAALMRGHDWQQSPLGKPLTWPSSLCTVVGLMLGSKFPMFVAWGDELTILYNRAYADILGNKHPSAVGAPFRDVWSEIWDDISPLIAKAMAGEAVWIENLPLRMNRLGYDEDTWFTFSYSPVRDDDGAIAGMFCAVVETTGHVTAESEVRDLNASLERRVEERSSQLKRAEEHLRQSQKLEAIGQLTGGVAHDFNNLLTVIRGSADILKRDGLPEEKRLRYIAAISDTADRAAVLTGQLLAFARRQALKPVVFDAGASLGEVAEMIRTLVGPRVELDIQMPDDVCYILADRSQFDTALINLAANARDAMSGQGRLTITAKPVSGIPRMRDHPAVPGEFVAITLADTGIGIPADVALRIFEPFFTTKDVGKGTGLGLSQVFGFAKQSGGDIQVDSVEAVGTASTLYLPRTYPNVREAPKAAIAKAPVDGNGLCILLVEDNEQVGAFATQALKELGYDSVHALNAEHALRELGKDCDRFHVVFSDVVMPGMSGLELGQEIQRNYPGTPVVLTSGYSEVLAQNGEHGFELLHKPYSLEQLSQALRQAAGTDMQIGAV